MGKLRIPKLFSYEIKEVSTMQKIGNLLKEKRIELGLSIEDVSEKTRLTVKHIKALEEGDLTFFHDDLSYLRFFVKSYCDVVGVDFDEIKDELRGNILEYTSTFEKIEQTSHEQIEKNVAKSEKLSKVHSADAIKRKPKVKKPDVSLVSLIAIIGVVILIILFGFVVYMKSDQSKPDVPKTEIPVAPEANKGDDIYPNDEEKEDAKEEVEIKEMEIVKDGVTDYTINNLKSDEKLVIETTFNGSSSGYSVAVDGKEPTTADLFDVGATAKTELEVKKGMKITLNIGCMVQTDIKINGKVVKTDESINPSVFPGGCPRTILTFTIGEVYESAK